MGGCPDDEPPETMLFPADYRSTFSEGRNCRRSSDHDLHYVHIYADDAALGPYVDRDALFPEGATLVKEEHDFADDTCSGEILQWTVMVRLAEGTGLDTGEWRWQRVDKGRKVVSEDDPLCFGCHDECVQPDFYEFTCAVLP